MSSKRLTIKAWRKRVARAAELLAAAEARKRQRQEAEGAGNDITNGNESEGNHAPGQAAV